jgi:hypothetical protein
MTPSAPAIRQTPAQTSRTPTHDVVRIPDSRGGEGTAGDQLAQPLLAVDQRFAAKVAPVEEQQVEQYALEDDAAGVDVLQELKARGAVAAEGGDLAVDERGSARRARGAPPRRPGSRPTSRACGDLVSAASPPSRQPMR